MPALRSPGLWSTAGTRAAVWASAGRPSPSTPTVTIASRRSSSRSVRSSRVSPSFLRWVCRQRSPRSRPRPARRRPQSGSAIEWASPTITCWTSPRRSSRTPTWRRISRLISVRCRASSCVISRSAGTRRRKSRSSRRVWPALRPRVSPKTSMGTYLRLRTRPDRAGRLPGAALLPARWSCGPWRVYMPQMTTGGRAAASVRRKSFSDQGLSSVRSNTIRWPRAVPHRSM